MRYQTLLKLGSATHPDFVEKIMFDHALSFCTMFPAVVKSDTHLVHYDVPHSHISGYVDHNKTHSIETDHLCRWVKVYAVETLHQPLVIYQPDPPSKSDFDRMTIYRQLVFSDTFLLKDEADFHHVNFIKSRTDATIQFNSKDWLIRFQESYVCPYKSLSNPDEIYFKCRPQYSVDISTEGYPDAEIISDFCEVALPRLFRLKRHCSK